MRRRPVTDEELDTLARGPRPGEVWWCDGREIGMNDGSKTRPALVVAIVGDGVSVVPLTSRKPEGNPVAITHRGGLSWIAGSPRTVAPRALISSLGPWSGFARWRR